MTEQEKQRDREECADLIEALPRIVNKLDGQTSLLIASFVEITEGKGRASVGVAGSEEIIARIMIQAARENEDLRKLLYKIVKEVF